MSTQEQSNVFRIGDTRREERKHKIKQKKPCKKFVEWQRQTSRDKLALTTNTETRYAIADDDDDAMHVNFQVFQVVRIEAILSSRPPAARCFANSLRRFSSQL